MTKNYIVIAVVVVAIIGGGLFLSKNKATKNETPTSTTKSPSVVPTKSNTGQTVSGSKAEEAYVELLAQTTYHAGTNNQNSWTSQNENDLFAKYGVTKEEVDAFSKALRNDPVRAKAVTIKVLQRTQELQRTGN